jgi:two-component system LytT family sensor kinase
MNKTKLYWLCQVGGWLFFNTIEMITYADFFGFSTLLIVNGLVNLFIGIFLTHLYRLFLIRVGWLSLPLSKLIPRSLLGVLVMSVVMSLLNFTLDWLTVPQLQLGQIPAFTIAITYLFNFTKYILLWALIYHLFQYWERSLKAERDSYQLAATIKENQYNNLKSQLNPHFLFNSLNSIRTLVDINPETAKVAITQLSGLLRSSLQMGKHKTVMLKDELETVKDYLAIEKIRFDERLKIIFDIAPETLSVQVPPMMLQTLIENSVKHGISNLKMGGTITLRALIQNEYLIVEIMNTGRYEPKDGHVGVGIENTVERLKLLYDDKALFGIGNADSSHVIANIQIPL